jgi:hypothetical protein
MSNLIRRSTMKVNFESNDPEGAKMQDLSVSRLSFVMRRMAWLVSDAKVNLTDINGPHGGVDKRCRIELKTDKVGTVVITSLAQDWRGALEQSLSRANQTLLRIWRRKNTPRRTTVLSTLKTQTYAT